MDPKGKNKRFTPPKKGPTDACTPPKKGPTDACRRCVQLEGEITNLKSKVTDLESKITDLESENVDLKSKVGNLDGQVCNLNKLANRQYKIARRTCILDARAKVITRIGKIPLAGEVWDSYCSTLTVEDREKANITEAIWKLLTEGVKAGNIAAHVVNEEEIAYAVCAAPNSREVWKHIFMLAYDKDPEIIFNSEE